MKPRTWWAWLGCILAAGIALRLKVALQAPWYWDEGYMAELVQALAAGGRPRLGAAWQDGFFPLSTSLLAPLSALPFHKLAGLDGMAAVRAWAMALDGLGIILLALLGRRLSGPAAGLLAAAALSLNPFAVEFGARGFYHHFPALWILAAALAADKARRDGGAWMPASALAAGAALASGYWLWWSPPLLAWWAAQGRPAGMLRYLALAALLPALFVALNFLPDPVGAWWSLKSLLHTTAAGAPKDLSAFFAAVGRALGAFPFIAAGIAGLWLGTALNRGFLLPAILASLAFVEPIRQRGDISGMPYPFILGLPFFCLGLGSLAGKGLSGAWMRRFLLPAALALALWPVNLEWMRAWSVEQARTREMAQALKERAGQGDLVLGLPNFNWLLGPELVAGEPFDVGLSEGRRSGFYGAGAPADRIAYRFELEEVRYLVTCRVHFLGLFLFPGASTTFLKAESQGWPEVWTNRSFKIFENPRFGSKTDLSVKILEDPQWYKAAAAEAEWEGRQSLADFAKKRGAMLP